MNKYLKKEIFISATMLAIALVCIFYQMELMMYVGIHALAIFIFLLMGFLVWKNKSIDERDILHKTRASDVAFIFTGLTLSTAIFIQIYQTHTIDVWLMITLIVMISSRTITRFWLDRYK